jgi:hypothetical protein
MESVNKVFSLENLRMWLNRAKNFGVTESEASALVRAAYARPMIRSAYDEQRPATPAQVAKSFEQ